MNTDQLLGSEKVCFIISPIGSKLEPLGSDGRARYEESISMWEEVLEPATAIFALEAIRSDKITDTGEIPDQIFTYLRDAEVVIADLSHANPNVMYELGLRHSRADRITIQIGEYGQLPFDVTTIRTIQFKRNTAGLIEARNQLTEALRTALRGGGSPVRATTVFSSTSPVRFDEKKADVEKSKEPDNAIDVDEPGTLDILAEGEQSLNALGAILERMSSTLNDVGLVTKRAGSQIQKSDAGGAGFAGRLRVAKTLAEELHPLGEVFEEDGIEFHSGVQVLDTMVLYIIDRLVSGDEHEDEGGIIFTRSLLGMLDAAETGAAGIVNFREGTRSLRKMSRILEGEAKTLVRGADRFLEGIAIMSGWRSALEEAEQVLQDRLAD